jgi:hypothetical protein
MSWADSRVLETYSDQDPELVFIKWIPFSSIVALIRIEIATT